MDTKNILIVGVGGQGTLLTSRVVGNLALDLGFDVKMSEVHGMAQRGGSVVTHVRYGEKVFSPLVEVGQADIIIAFEKMEALRWIHYLKKDGAVIVNDQAIDPMPVIMGVESYPNDVINQLSSRCARIYVLRALDIAKQLGSIRSANIVLLGVLAQLLDIDREQWIRAIKNTVPPKTVEVNVQAFMQGYSVAQSQV